MFSSLPHRVKRPLRGAYETISASLARYFVAGTTLEDALVVCRRFESSGWSLTVCPWDGAGDAPRTVFESYLEALSGCCATRPGSRLAIKLPSLKYDRGMVRELLERTLSAKVMLHFDAMAPDTAEPTFAVIQAFRSEFNNIGCTLPARWQRSTGDAERALELGVAVRLVKGQWPDPDGKDREPREAFLQLAQMLRGSQQTISLATHDAPLLRQTLQSFENTSAPAEVEQLFRLPIVSSEICRSRPRRIYVPYGHAYLPYALSRLVEKPTLAVWLLTHALEQRVGLKTPD